LLVEKDLLVKVANTCSDFASKSKVTAALKHIYITGNVASSTNGNTGVLMTLPHSFPSAWSTDGEKFQRILGSTKAEKINLDTSTKDLIKISADSYKIKAFCINPTGLPIVAVPPTTQPLPPAVWQAIKEVYPFVCKDNIHKELRSILVSDDGYAYATDNIAAARAKHGVKGWKTLEIPDVLLSKIIDYPEIPEYFAVTASHVWFFYKNMSVYTGLMEHKFPNVGLLFAQQDKRKEELKISYKGEEVVDALQRISIFTKEFKETASITFSPDKMKISYESDSDAQIDEVIEFNVVNGQVPTEELLANVPKLTQCFGSADTMVLYIDKRLRFLGGTRDIVCQTNTAS
jgi:hypothetical protein